MMELGACVSLLGKCHPLGCDRMQHEKTKVARFAKVTGRSDSKTFSLATTCHSDLPRVFLNMPFVYALFHFDLPMSTMVGLKLHGIPLHCMNYSWFFNSFSVR